MSATRDFALSCPAANWFIFPLGEKSKVPDAKLAPQGFKSASNIVVQIDSWWTASPNANPGIDLGRSNLTVFDFDQGEPPAELIPYLKDRYAVKTARGLHIYFSGVTKQQKMYFNGQHIGEIKSDGGYVLAPYSVHPDGPVYTPVLYNGKVGAIDTLPDDLLRLITKAELEKKESQRNANGLVPHGHIHDYLVRDAGRLRAMGMSINALETALLDLAHTNCEPPIDDSKVKQVARSFEKYEQGRNTELIQNMKPDQTTQVATDWRDAFRSVGEMENGPIIEVVKGVLQEGTCFVGANPGDGKTLVCLALAKAICTGEPLFGLPQFPVPQPRPVIYLIPESRDRAFRRRCESFRIPDDKSKFMCRTTSAGPVMPLTDPQLLQAVKETNAVVFLDTAARFMKTTDENSAAQNQALVNDVLGLQQAGAILVVLVHHATKASQNESMTLENMLRGTSDFAAMCDQAYGIRKDRALYAHGNGPMQIDLVSLKDREQIGQLTTLRLAASRKSDPGCIIPTVSIIDETGNFNVVSDAETSKRTVDSLVSMIERDPGIKMAELVRASGQSEYSVETKLHYLGWHRIRGGKGGSSPWHKDDGKPCPYAKQPKAKGPGITEAIAFLTQLLAGTSLDGECVPEAEVYQKADVINVSDDLINKAKKRLAVRVTKVDGEKVWTLPAAEQESVNLGQPQPQTVAA